MSKWIMMLFVMVLFIPSGVIAQESIDSTTGGGVVNVDEEEPSKFHIRKVVSGNGMTATNVGGNPGLTGIVDWVVVRDEKVDSFLHRVTLEDGSYLIEPENTTYHLNQDRIVQLMPMPYTRLGFINSSGSVSFGGMCLAVKQNGTIAPVLIKEDGSIDIDPVIRQVQKGFPTSTNAWTYYYGFYRN